MLHRRPGMHMSQTRIPVSFFFIFLAHRHGCSRTAAHSKHVGKCHKQYKDRVCQADCRHLQRIAGLSDKKVSAMLYTTVTRLLITLGIAIFATAFGTGRLLISSFSFIFSPFFRWFFMKNAFTRITILHRYYPQYIMGESSFVQVSFAHFFFLFNIFTAISGETIFCSPVFALIFHFRGLLASSL